MSTYWLAYAVVTTVNAALFAFTLRTGLRIQRLLDIAKAQAWDEGYATGTRDAEMDWFAADNPYREFS